MKPGGKSSGNQSVRGVYRPLGREAGVRDHRLLLPAAALLGGSLLVSADTLARTLLAPHQLPVGVLTALVGVPLFLALLHHSHNVLGEAR